MAATRQTHAAGWTDDRVAQLRQLWREGASASQIARQLGGGLTPNGVIGKAHRLGLDPRRNPILPASRTGLHVSGRRGKAGNPGLPKINGILARKATFAEQAAMHGSLAHFGNRAFRTATKIKMGAPPDGPHLHLVDLGTDQCRWIDGDPMGEHSFCGAAVKPGTSWCPAHHARVYLRAEPKKNTQRTSKDVDGAVRPYQNRPKQADNIVDG